MLWFGRQAEDAAARDGIEPAELSVGFDPEIGEHVLNQLLANIDEREGRLVDFVGSLSRKHELFARVLAEDRLPEIDETVLDTVTETVFTARRKLPDVFARTEHRAVVAAMERLLFGGAPLAERMQAFAAALPVEGKKESRAAWDLGAELLHFRAPERYPLMTRWVWDKGTETGALRELIRNNDSMRVIPLEAAPGTFEAARAWLAEELTSRGFYRDLHFLVDLVQAQAYAIYMHGIASGVGMFSAELGTKSDPLEFIAKLLGIEPARPAGKSRLKRQGLH